MKGWLARTASYPFAARGEIALDKLDGQPILEREGGSGTAASVARALAERGLRPPTRRSESEGVGFRWQPTGLPRCDLDHFEPAPQYLASTDKESMATTDTMTFDERLRATMRRADSLVCVGLDPDPARGLPGSEEQSSAEAIVAFNAAIIEATRDLVCAYKPNLGFYIARGQAGIEALVATRRLIPPEIPVILDCKVGDMANTAAAYARGYFEVWNFDAVTVNPYLGHDSLLPFLAAPGRGLFVLAKTSNPGSADLQDLIVRDDGQECQLALAVTDRAAAWAREAAATVGLVVGATYPAELTAIRRRAPRLPILLPGVGAQGGEVAAAVRAGVDDEGEGLIVSASRSIIYAGDGADFADRARAATERLRAEINQRRRGR